MKSIRSLSLGLLSSAASSLVIIGAILAALAEGLVVAPAQIPTEPIPVVEFTPEPGQTAGPSPTPGPTRTVVANITATPILPQACPRPVGWEAYTLKVGDSAEDLAVARGITLRELLDKNCLVSAQFLQPENIIYLPPLPPTPTLTPTPSLTPSITPTPTLKGALTATRCGPPPAGWVPYRVKSGDSLSIISAQSGASILELMQANCLPNDKIIAGTVLYVPNYYTRTPTRTLVPPSNTPAPTFTRTATGLPPTFTPTMTLLPSGTPTPTLPATPTDTPTGTSTATATVTSPPPPPPTATYTATSTRTPTSTVAPVETTPPGR